MAQPKTKQLRKEDDCPKKKGMQPRKKFKIKFNNTHFDTTHILILCLTMLLTLI